MNHIDGKGIGIIRRLYKYLSRKAVIYHKPTYHELYCAYYSERVRSDQAHTNELFTNKIDGVQYNAALAITGGIRGTSKEKMYSELG